MHRTDVPVITAITYTEPRPRQPCRFSLFLPFSPVPSVRASDRRSFTSARFNYCSSASRLGISFVPFAGGAPSATKIQLRYESGMRRPVRIRARAGNSNHTLRRLPACPRNVAQAREFSLEINGSRPVSFLGVKIAQIAPFIRQISEKR